MSLPYELGLNCPHPPLLESGYEEYRRGPNQPCVWNNWVSFGAVKPRVGMEIRFTLV